MGTIKTTNIEPIADNGTVTLGSSGDTFTVPSGVTVNMSSATQTGVGGVNTPAFEAVLSSDFNITDQTYQKIPFATEVFDTASAFDSSTNYRFTVPSGQAGKYYFYAQLDHQGTAMTANWTLFKKNGSYIRGSHFDADNVTYNSQRLTGILDLAVSDYIEVWGYNDTTSGTNSVAKSFTIDSAETFTTFFGGYKLIE